MPKVITLRLSDGEYKEISTVAKIEHRPISNFITATVLREVEASYFVDPIEMAQIRSDKKLLGKLKKGHDQAKRKKGRMVG